jgi:hypothetical protein
VTSPLVRATFRQPQDRKAACAAPAPDGAVSTARSSVRPPSRASASSRPMPCRRQDARTIRSVSANVRPGRSSVTSSGSGVVSPRHQDVDARSGIPAAYPTR